MSAPARRSVAVGQRFTEDWNGEKIVCHRLPNDDGHYVITFEWPRGIKGTKLVRTLDVEWWWSRGFTPVDPMCYECRCTDGVRIYPRRYSPMGEDPMCATCKAKQIAAAAQ